MTWLSHVLVPVLTMDTITLPCSLPGTSWFTSCRARPTPVFRVLKLPKYSRLAQFSPSSFFEFHAIQVSFTGYDVEDAVVVPHQDPRIRRAVGF